MFSLFLKVYICSLVTWIFFGKIDDENDIEFKNISLVIGLIPGLNFIGLIVLFAICILDHYSNKLNMDKKISENSFFNWYYS